MLDFTEKELQANNSKGRELRRQVIQLIKANTRRTYIQPAADISQTPRTKSLLKEKR